MNNSEIAHTFNDINYSVVFSRRRSIGISVSPDKGVVIRAPFRTSSETIKGIVLSKASWIKKHQRRFLKLDRSAAPINYSDGSTHLFIGNLFNLKIVKSGKIFVKRIDDFIEIGHSDTADTESIKKIMYRWYKDEATLFFSIKLKEVLSRCESYNFKPTSLVVRTMKRRWGSCSVNGKITLSTELIKMTEPCIEYVIIHELCHLKHHNHGKEFYALMSEIEPDWKIFRRQLRDHVM
jgi:predicted metal-dependent hydrolase